MWEMVVESAAELAARFATYYAARRWGVTIVLVALGIVFGVLMLVYAH